MNRLIFGLCVLVVLGGCTHGSGRGDAASTTTTAAAAQVSVEGEAVQGAPVTVVVQGLTGHAGQEAGVVIRALDDDAYSEHGNQTVAPDGTFRLELSIPRILNHEGPCKTTAPCDQYPVRPGKYRLGVFVGNSVNVVAAGDLTVVPGRAGVPYQTALTNECGPPRVHFDGTAWVLSSPRPSQHWDDSGLTPGTITLLDPHRATFNTGQTGPIELQPADAATMATIGC